MTLQIDFWQLALLLLSFFGACAAGGKLLLLQTQKHLDERFTTQQKHLDERFANQDRARTDNHDQLSRRLDGLEQVNRDETIQWQRVEREMLKFQAEMPMKYVMRDDYIRGQTTIEAKLDAIAVRVDNAQLRTMLTGGGS